MATISITIPDDQVNRVVNAMCEAGHWTPELGITKNNFAKAELARLLRERVLTVERQKVRADAEAALAALTEPDVSG
jgi:hypothetical protein